MRRRASQVTRLVPTQLGGTLPPRYPPAHASTAASGTSVIGCSRTGRAQRPPCLPWVVVEERVQGGATGLRCDRATLRLAPEEAAQARACHSGTCWAVHRAKRTTSALHTPWGQGHARPGTLPPRGRKHAAFEGSRGTRRVRRRYDR